MERCYVTNNKINIFQYPGDHLHSFCLSMYINAGCIYETSENNGISHFLEHVIIRNINHVMDGELYKYLDRYGLVFNACTYKEFVQFEITGATKNFMKAVEVFVKTFEEIKLPASEIDVERNRIKAEIREDDDKKKLAYFSNQIVWKGTPAAQTITGSSSGINKIRKKELQQEHERIMAADNLFLYVTGNVEQAGIDFLVSSLEKYDVREQNLGRNNTVEVPEGFGRRNGIVGIKEHKDSVVRFSFDLDFNEHSLAVHELLYDILFECENSKLHQKLSEEAGYIYSFDSSFDDYRNVGTMFFQYEVQQSKLIESVDIVVKLLQELKSGITDELDYVKPTYIDNGELILDEVANLNWCLAYEGHILAKTSTDFEVKKAAYESVTKEQVTELAYQIFQTRNLVVTVKGKKSIRIEKQIKEIIGKLDQED